MMTQSREILDNPCAVSARDNIERTLYDPSTPQIIKDILEKKLPSVGGIVVFQARKAEYQEKK